MVAGPLMGLSVPIAGLVRPRVEGEHVRVLTYNVGPQKIDDVGLAVMIELQGIDLVCFQEWRSDPAIESYLSSKGWYRDRSHRIASRFPIVAELEPLAEDWTTEQRYAARLNRVRLRAPSGVEFVAASVHLPTVRWGFHRLWGGNVAGLKLHLDWWRHEMERVASALAEVRGTPLIVGGDFNMPEDDSTMAALGASYRYAFDEAGWGYGYTRPAPARGSGSTTCWPARSGRCRGAGSAPTSAPTTFPWWPISSCPRPRAAARRDDRVRPRAGP